MSIRKTTRRLLRGRINPDIMEAMRKGIPVPKELLFMDYHDKLEWVAISEVEKYANQEQISERKIQELINHWDPTIFDPPKVGRYTTDGHLEMGAGHHRMIALERMGQTMMPVYIIPVSSREEVAKIYNDDAISDIRSKKATHILLSSLVAGGNPEAVMIDNTLRKHGFTISDKRDAHSIRAVDCIINITERYGIEILDQVMEIMERAFGGKEQFLTSTNLGAMADLLNDVSTNPNFDINIFIERLSPISYQTLRSMVINMPAYGTLKTEKARTVEAFRIIYNSRRKKNII